MSAPPSSGADRAGALGGWAVVVTCEHGGNEVPEGYEELFAEHAELLASHRGWDPGTLALARDVARRFGAQSICATVTRLLVDLNRSRHNPRVFSVVTRRLPRVERMALLRRFHLPHWERVRATIAVAVAERGRVLHLAIHSFTPELDGEVRKPDIALLYDPTREAERSFAAVWVRRLREIAPDRVIRRNDPYRGAADGLTTALRRDHPEERYLGIEVEVNQRHVGSDGRFPPWVADALGRSLERVPARPR
jgi:predicted N-formylglutamate amidohydrolase